MPILPKYRRPRRLAAVFLAALTAATLAASPALAGTSSTVIANWQMNEPAGATVMVDSSGNHLNGAIGSKVIVGNGVYTFDPAVGDVRHAREVGVPTDPLLNPGPGSHYFSVEARFQTGAKEGKIVEKGQAATPGGYWKLAFGPAGTTTAHPLCFFRDANGTTESIRAFTVSVNDHKWHDILCEHLATGVAMTIDGVRHFQAKTIGNLSNTWTLAVGGKWSCNGTRTADCDYYEGQIDSVVIRAG